MIVPNSAFKRQYHYPSLHELYLHTTIQPSTLMTATTFPWFTHLLLG